MCISRSERICGESCVLCEQALRGSHHAHPEKWPSDLQEFLSTAKNVNVSASACICKACEASARRGLKAKKTGKSCVLRWMKGRELTVPMCCVPTCAEVARVINHSFSWQTISSCVGIASVTEGDPEPPAPLCTAHYSAVYRLSTSMCAVCGVKRSHRDSTTVRFISCPEPKKVESILHETGNFEREFGEGDVVCYNCYRFINRMLKSNVCMLSTDNVISLLQEKEKHFQMLLAGFKVTSDDSYVEFALLKTALYVSKQALSDKAVLFPEIYQAFCDLIPEEKRIGVYRGRLLSFVSNEFGELLSSICCHPHVGRMFFRSKADPYVMLSHALNRKSSHRIQLNTDNVDSLNDGVNRLVHYQVTEANSDPMVSVQLNVDRFISTVRSVAPGVWEHVCALTRSVNERKGRKAATIDGSLTSQIKQLRRAYLLGVLLFTTNSECSNPFHLMLADAVEACGGSTELLRILNHVGAVASVDSLKRMVHTISHQRREAGLDKLLVKGAFTVATVDNIDFLQSHAAVYSGSQHRSWHATSIQLIQPKPKACNDETDICSTPSVRRQLFDTGCSTPSMVTPSGNTEPLTLGREQPFARNPVNPHTALDAVLRGKQKQRSSPVSSPLRQTRSPHSKKIRRARTFMEARILTGETTLLSELPVSLKRGERLACPERLVPQFEKFLLDQMETDALRRNTEIVFQYMLHREACGSDPNFVDLKTLLGLTKQHDSDVEQSNVVYLSIVDMHADTPEAIETVVTKLHEEFGIGVKAKFLVVVGDQKTYARLQEIKHLYGSELAWLIPFIGDWHLLKNFQSVLMKVYYDAGLKVIAEAAGYRGETLTSLQKCSNFKRTHQFLQQSWEAFYRHMFATFLSSQPTGCSEKLLTSVKQTLSGINEQCKQSKNVDSLCNYITVPDRERSKLHADFMDYISNRAKKDSNWIFWKNFVFRDASAYNSLFVAVRGGLWKLRLASIKQIAPLFAAFDRPHYKKLLPQHLFEVLTMPKDVMQFFEAGGFVCSISGRNMHSVALDEAHETLVNKDLKTTIIRPSKEYVDRIIHYFPVRSQALKRLKSEVLLKDRNDFNLGNQSVFDASLSAKKVEENISAMRSKLESTAILCPSTEGTGLQSLSGTVATPEQAQDLLSFWEVGLQHFQSRVKYYVLQEPSASVPQRLNRLLTFASTKKVKRKVKAIERERKVVNRCVRRTMAWKNRPGFMQNCSGQQYLELPRAISDPSGNPHKGQKSYTTKWLEKRYTNIVTNHFPTGWVPEVVVLEGMFLINVTPLGIQSSMKEYASFLLRRFTLAHYVKGTKEVHIVFDTPGRQPNSPKAFERMRRDDVNTVPADHKHLQFSDCSEVPSKWREHLKCRVCKRSLVLYLGKAFLAHAQSILRGCQKLVLAGCFSGEAEDQAWEVSITDKQPNPRLNCGAEEADTRVWLHTFRSPGTTKLVCSPDTDVYHIGLPLLHNHQCDVFVQISPFSSPEPRVLHLNELCHSLSRDPDLAVVPIEMRPKLLQSVFICTGCDYISFFSGIGKATFLRVFFQHGSFINANTDNLPGSLSDTTQPDHQTGFLAFVRLAGSTYFKKHLTAFQYESPRAHFNSFASQGVTRVAQHKLWLNAIRSTVWERIEFENELPPSWEALWRHWLRSCWVSHMWNQASHNQYSLLDVTEFGWKMSGNTLEIDWDDDDNVQQIKEHINLLLKGCSCKKGCSTKRCSCKKTGKICGPGCTCCNCQNTSTSPLDITEQSIDEVEAEELQQDEILRKQYQEELFDDDFGDDSHPEDEDTDLEDHEIQQLDACDMYDDM